MTFTHISEPIHILLGDTSARILRGCDAILLEDNLACGPAHSDPARHAEQRKAYWRALLDARTSMPARYRRQHIARLEAAIFGMRDLIAALATYPEERPVLLWTAPLWRERLSFWWTLEAIRQSGQNVERFWVAEPSIPYSASGVPQDTSLGAIPDERLGLAFASRRPLSRRELRSGANLWRKFAATSPRAFETARQHGSAEFPDFQIIAEIYGMFFPQVFGSRSTKLRLAKADQMLLDPLRTDAWTRPIDYLMDRKLYDGFLSLIGDTFITDRLHSLATHDSANPLLLSQRVPEGVNDLNGIAYRLTPHGADIRDGELDRASDVPPMFVGGCQVYIGKRPWVRRVAGRSWRIERHLHSAADR